MDSDFYNGDLDETTLTDFIIATLLSCRSTKIFRQILRERAIKRNKNNLKNFNQNLYRLKQKGIIEIKGKEIRLTSNNEKLANFNKYKFIHKKPEKNNRLLLMFDIPEKERGARDWLRNQIKLWDFKMIQKSVWLGTGPVPKEFTERIKFLGLEKNIKIFNIQNKK